MVIWKFNSIYKSKMKQIYRRIKSNYWDIFVSKILFEAICILRSRTTTVKHQELRERFSKSKLRFKNIITKDSSTQLVQKKKQKEKNGTNMEYM